MSDKVVRGTADALYKVEVIVPIPGDEESLSRERRYLEAHDCAEATSLAAALFDACLDQVVLVELVAEKVLRRSDVPRKKRGQA